MAQTFTQDEVRELMRRMGESMLEVLDADSSQCQAWNRRGEELITAMVTPAAGPCEYTFAHTRHWCGNPTCRDS